MVNPASELFEQHPDWVIRQPHREPELSRNQLDLDLSRPEVREFAWKVIDRHLGHNPGISYVKWDANRYITQPGSPTCRRTSNPTCSLITTSRSMRSWRAWPKTLPAGHGHALLGRRRPRGLRRAQVLPLLLAQRQYRPAQPRLHPMGLQPFLPRLAPLPRTSRAWAIVQSSSRWTSP